MKLSEGLRLRREIRILRRANNDLEAELALQKEYNGSNLRRIDRLEKENMELARKLMDKGRFILFAIPKRQTYLADRLQPIIETREPVITNDIKVSIFDELMAKGFIRKNREDDNFVMYELGLKTEVKNESTDNYLRIISERGSSRRGTEVHSCSPRKHISDSRRELENKDKRALQGEQEKQAYSGYNEAQQNRRTLYPDRNIYE
jgi:hypothetical protein